MCCVFCTYIVHITILPMQIVNNNGNSCSFRFKLKAIWLHSKIYHQNLSPHAGNNKSLFASQFASDCRRFGFSSLPIVVQCIHPFLIDLSSDVNKSYIINVAKYEDANDFACKKYWWNPFNEIEVNGKDCISWNDWFRLKEFLAKSLRLFCVDFFAISISSKSICLDRHFNQFLPYLNYTYFTYFLLV